MDLLVIDRLPIAVVKANSRRPMQKLIQLGVKKGRDPPVHEARISSLTDVVKPTMPTASSDEPVAWMIGRPVENRRGGTIGKPPPTSKTPDSVPVASADAVASVIPFSVWRRRVVVETTVGKNPDHLAPLPFGVVGSQPS